MQGQNQTCPIGRFRLRRRNCLEPVKSIDHNHFSESEVPILTLSGVHVRLRLAQFTKRQLTDSWRPPSHLRSQSVCKNLYIQIKVALEQSIHQRNMDINDEENRRLEVSTYSWFNAHLIRRKQALVILFLTNPQYLTCLEHTPSKHHIDLHWSWFLWHSVVYLSEKSKAGRANLRESSMVSSR